MQYSLILLAAFATASIAASDASPPASTQGSEDVAADTGKLAEEACPPSQNIVIGRFGYALPQANCKPLADKCIQDGITEATELKKCIVDARASELKALNPALNTKKPTKEVGKLAKEACPPSQTISIGRLGFSLAQADCIPLADKCVQGGITEAAELKKCIIDARASELKTLNPALDTEKPAEDVGKLAEDVGKLAEDVGKLAEDVGKLAEEACPPSQNIIIGRLGFALPQADCKPLADKCVQDGITEPTELKKCITDARGSQLDMLKNTTLSTQKPARTA